MVAMPEIAPAQKLDDETAAALTLFNEYVIADREVTRHKRDISKAEKAKDQAAAEVRKLDKEGGSATGKTAAETAYRDAAAKLKQVRDGVTAEPELSEPGPEESAAEPELSEPGPEESAAEPT